jgi:hypothetical protein
MAAMTLAMRALGKGAPRIKMQVSGDAAIPSPYRAATTEQAPPQSEVVGPLDEAARLRFLTGAAFCLYLSIWTIGWTRGSWPAHILGVDLGMATVVLLAVWKLRARLALLPATIAGGHFVLGANLIPAPTSLVEWGASAVALGFVLLVVAIAINVIAHQRRKGALNVARDRAAEPSP